MDPHCALVHCFAQPASWGSSSLSQSCLADGGRPNEPDGQNNALTHKRGLYVCSKKLGQIGDYQPLISWCGHFHQNTWQPDHDRHADFVAPTTVVTHIGLSRFLSGERFAVYRIHERSLYDGDAAIDDGDHLGQ